MRCACEFHPETGDGIKMCAYHLKAFQYLTKTVRDTERLRIVDKLREQSARSASIGDARYSLILLGTANEIAGEKAPLKVPMLKPNKDDVIR